MPIFKSSFKKKRESLGIKRDKNNKIDPNQITNPKIKKFYKDYNIKIHELQEKLITLESKEIKNHSKASKRALLIDKYYEQIEILKKQLKQKITFENIKRENKRFIKHIQRLPEILKEIAPSLKFPRKNQYIKLGKLYMSFSDYTKEHKLKINQLKEKDIKEILENSEKIEVSTT